MNHNILVTSAGKRVALLKCIKETLSRYFTDAKVYTTDMNPQYAPAKYFSEECFEVPRVTENAYIDILLNLCIQNNIGLVIPTIDTELLILASSKERFLKYGIVIVVSDEEFVQKCRDKRKTIEFFTQNGIRVPATRDINNPIFPIFAKPYDGSLSKDLYLIKSRADITPDILGNEKLIFMEYINKQEYDEYTVDIYIGSDNNVKSIIPRKRIEIRAGEINKGITEKNILVPYLKERLGHIDGCMGCICLQLFYNRQSGDIVGIEINPRFGGGYPLSYQAKGNYIEYLIREYFLGDDVEYTDDWIDNMLMLRYDDAVYIG